MDGDPEANQFIRGPWFAVTCLVVFAVLSLSVLYMARHSVFVRNLTSRVADQPRPGGDPDWVPTPDESQATIAPSPPPIPGLTVAMIARKLPTSWKLTFKLDTVLGGRSYVATTTKALAGVQLHLGVDLKASDHIDRIYWFGCPLTAGHLKPDTATLGVLTACLHAVLPTADVRPAASWVDHTATGLNGRADLRSFDIGGFVVYLEHLSPGALSVSVVEAS